MKKIKITLLIDNDNIDNFVNQKILESCRVTNILTLTSTIDALNYLKQTRDAPQLILLDIRFPIMDGFEFLDEFKKIEIAKQSIKIFILSASSNPLDIEKARQQTSGYIEKPLTKEKLLQLLEMG